MNAKELIHKTMNDAQNLDLDELEIFCQQMAMLARGIRTTKQKKFFIEGWLRCEDAEKLRLDSPTTHA